MTPQEMLMEMKTIITKWEKDYSEEGGVGDQLETMGTKPKAAGDAIYAKAGELLALVDGTIQAMSGGAQ